MRCPFLWADEIGRVVSKKILSCFGTVWRSTVLHEDGIIVRNQIDTWLIRLLSWKFFCNPSTSPSFVSKGRNNNHQIDFWKNIQCNLQARYLHNLSFNSPYVIKRLSMTSLMTSLKFTKKGNRTYWSTSAQKEIFPDKVHTPLLLRKLRDVFCATRIYNFRSGSEAQCASSYQISWRSVETVCRRRKKWVGKKDRSLKIYKWVLGAVRVTQGHWQCHRY